MTLAPFGLAVGHASDEAGATGCTVVRGIDGPFRAAAAVFGRATGTRELHVLSPDHLVDRVDAIFLTGGSAYGLDATAGVMRWMADHGRGFDVGVGVVPIVPAAVLFDLGLVAPARPTHTMAYDACDAATSTDIAEGSVGAGTGATVGKAARLARAMKGGVGLAVRQSRGVSVAALAVVNAFGDVRDAEGRILAGAREEDGSFADSLAVIARGTAAARFRSTAAPAMQNTTLCLVATDVAFDRVQLRQIARAAGAALHRRITPVGTSFDGDVVFACCPPAAPAGDALLALQAESVAVAALEEAIERGVRLARGRDGVPGLADEVRP